VTASRLADMSDSPGIDALLFEANNAFQHRAGVHETAREIQRVAMV